MRRVKVPGLDIQIPPGGAFKIETPPMMPKMHLLAAVVAPRGYGKGVITTNLIEQLKVVDRLILVSPSAASNKALNDRLKRILASEDMFDNPNDISVLDSRAGDKRVGTPRLLEDSGCGELSKQLPLQCLPVSRRERGCLRGNEAAVP